MNTQFKIIKPDPRLEPYVDRFFVLETSGTFPGNDLKLIVPNGCPKLVFPFRNGLSGKSAGWHHVTLQNKIALIGISDIPFNVDVTGEGPAGNITVEFNALGAYRFFNGSLDTFANRIFTFSDLLQRSVNELENWLLRAEGLQSKINIIQAFVIDKIHAHPADATFDHCVQQIIRTRGRVSLAALEKQTGYSARWLNKKFKQNIGVSPKNLSSIVRFQQYYHALVTGSERFFLEKEFYNYFYDRSHFTKDFKRFTGHTPLFFSRASNHYDRIFYRE